jgi:A/G-specific adenine glycosylase
MLQQTTVETVIPYYERFLQRFPNLRRLAQASEEEVLKLWSGLGYYSRARNLHRAARMLSTLPRTVEELLQLPGIGRYTAGAISSIAFDQRAPILDGNVIRVLSRLFMISADPKSSRGQKIFWKKAEEVLPRTNCGDFNQALMELGATICLSENPLCLLCPVASSCAARKRGNPESYPAGRKGTDYQDVPITAAVIRKEDKILVVKRPDRGLLKGMWELPMTEGNVRDLCRDWPVEVISSLPTVRHSVLNRRLRITPVLCRLDASIPAHRTCRWIVPSQLAELPSSSMNRKILNLLNR